MLEGFLTHSHLPLQHQGMGRNGAIVMIETLPGPGRFELFLLWLGRLSSNWPLLFTCPVNQGPSEDIHVLVSPVWHLKLNAPAVNWGLFPPQPLRINLWLLTPVLGTDPPFPAHPCPVSLAAAETCSSQKFSQSQACCDTPALMVGTTVLQCLELTAMWLSFLLACWLVVLCLFTSTGASILFL